MVDADRVYFEPSKFTHTPHILFGFFVILLCFCFLLGTISLFRTFQQRSWTWAWAHSANLIAIFFLLLSISLSLSHSPLFTIFLYSVFIVVFVVQFSVYRLVLDWFSSCGWISLVCCILVCTSISKCQYNFQFSYDFRPFLSLFLTAFVCGQLVCVCECVYIHIAVLWNYILFITSTHFFPHFVIYLI